MSESNNQPRIGVEPETRRPEGYELRISKRTVWGITCALVILLLATVLWQTGWYLIAWRAVAPAMITVTVTAQDTHQPLAQTRISLGQQSGATDDKGLLTLSHLWVGTLTLSTTLEGYVTQKTPMRLHRGANNAVVALVRDVRTTTLNGTIKDFVTDESIGSVDVALSSLPAVKTDDQGRFSIASVPVGEATLHLKKDGYVEADRILTVADTTRQDLTLTPTGTTIFVSNRDAGKQGLFVSNYDGTNIQALVKRKDDTEDSNPVLRDDGKLVAFLSTRDKVATSDNLRYESKLYLITSDGKDLAKISDHFGITRVQWVLGGTKLLWTAREKSDDQTDSVYEYDVAKRTTKKLSGDNGSVGNVWLDHSRGAALWQKYQGNDPTGDQGLYFYDLGSDQTKRVTDQTSISSASFSLDDSSVVYKEYDPETQKTVHRKFSISSGDMTTFTPSPNDSEYSEKLPSPDMKTLAYITQRDGAEDVFTSDAAGTNEVRRTIITTAVPSSAFWDPTGRFILFDSSKTGETARYIVGRQSGIAKKVTDISLQYGDGPGNMGM